jgi:succinyl-CoA synthetase beta subunit
LTTKVASSTVGGVRNLNLHEYQSIGLLKAHGATVQNGEMAENGDAAKKIADSILSSNPKADLIVKAQIHAGGRGKGHFTNGYKKGVHILNNSDDVKVSTNNMIGNYLVTKQTGPEGQLCQKVLVNEGIDIIDEKYFAILLDRAHNGAVMVGSRKGGMNIEEVAEESPEEIISIPIDTEKGMTTAQAEEMAQKIGFVDGQIAKAANNMMSLYKLFTTKDATQVEINPMATATDGNVYCVDAKLNFDDNASYRQAEIFNMRDVSMEDERDVKAEQAGLNYIGLDGNIGCMVNGAGLAMATMDIIDMYGGSPANFLDVGGGATKEGVSSAFKILNSDPNVKCILVNIFGGIVKCDLIAQGIVDAYKELNLQLPIVVRLAGTNVSIGQEIIKNSQLPLINASDLNDAADKAVKSIASA